MSRLVWALLAGVSWPAMAATEPPAISNDGLICAQVYGADSVTIVHLEVSRTATVELSPSETIKKIAASDTAHLSTSHNGSNVMWLKPSGPLAPQPISVLTAREDGTSRLYTLQVDAKPPVKDPEAINSDIKTVSVASADADIKEVTPQAPKPCYLVRFTYPDDVKAAVKAQSAAVSKEKADRWLAVHDAAIIRQSQLASQNWKYLGQGDRNLAPDRIFDDGYSTFLEFHGNRPLPAPYEVGFGGKDKLLTGWNTEDNVCPGGIAKAATCLKLHAVLKQIRLRDREDFDGKKPSLIVFNKGFDAVGNNPGTGTSSPDVRREVR